jgi:hypothetical protein
MSSSAHAHAFYREVATKGVWTIGIGETVQTVLSKSGARVMPLWSSRTRVERIIKTVPGYGGLNPLASSWANFVRNWVKQLDDQGVLVGVNWSGLSATGFEFPASHVAAEVSAVARLQKKPRKPLKKRRQPKSGRASLRHR